MCKSRLPSAFFNWVCVLKMNYISNFIFFKTISHHKQPFHWPILNHFYVCVRFIFGLLRRNKSFEMFNLLNITVVLEFITPKKLFERMDEIQQMKSEKKSPVNQTKCLKVCGISIADALPRNVDALKITRVSERIDVSDSLLYSTFALHICHRKT